METADRYAEWEKLCEDLNIAQGEYMELHGILVRKAVGAGPGRGGGPSEGDFRRAQEARKRVEELQASLDTFLDQHVEPAKPH
jgi:hypothetical protein